MRVTFRELLQGNKKFIGTYMMFRGDMELEIMKLAGVDFVIFDLEHEQLTFADIMPMIRTCDSCGLAAMVRVPGASEEAIKKALDIGASAIKVPGIATAEQAREVVAYCKYPPEGVRGVCPFVRANAYGTDPGCWDRANREVVVSVIIEGEEGIRNMEEIIAVPGIDTISIGNMDLSAAYGVPGQAFHSRVIEAVKQCAALCEKYGKSCSTQVVKPEDAVLFKDCKGISHYHTDLPPLILYRAFKSLCDGLIANS